jgi:HK97 family phage portal protein
MNAGRPMILEGGTEWKPLGINPEDAQMLESRMFGIEEACRFFAVPPPMIGHTAKASSWPSSLEQQLLIFQKFSLLPRCVRIETRASKQLLTDKDRAAGITIEHNFEGLLRGDTQSRFAAYEIALRNGVKTINEVRRRENDPPIAGGDVARLQMQNVPIAQAAAMTDVAEEEDA